MKVSPLAELAWPDQAQKFRIPSGAEGTRATLRLMAVAAKKSSHNPRIIQLARNIVANVPGHKARFAWAEEIAAWVRENVQYVNDPYGLESLTEPAFNAQLAGDCDDHAMMTAALLLAVGINARYVAVGRSLNALEHVYTEARIGPHWVPLETTEEIPVELLPQLPARMVEHI